MIQIFKRKNLWELIVLSIASLLALATIILSNYIANNLAEKEAYQVKLWADVIQKKAKLLELSNEIFINLSLDERKKVELNAKATKLIVTESDNDKLSFFLDILKFNENIPTISTDSKHKILEYRNINNPAIQKDSILDSVLFPEFFKFKPIEIQFEKNINYIYYKESIIFIQLMNYINNSGKLFFNEIGDNTSSLPVLIVDENDSIFQKGNIPDEIWNNKEKKLDFIANIKSSNPPIILELEKGKKKYIYYKNSSIIGYLKWFPIFLYGAIAILIFITYSAISNARKIEKNQIWVGMSKETAHQLGTPISSLGAWLEVFKEDNGHYDEHQKNILNEMEKDINRLSLIADRFSKIGSKPKLESTNLYNILFNSLEYLKLRAPKKVQFELNVLDNEVKVDINKPLFEWVVENLVRNALDAIPHDGKIIVNYIQVQQKVFIDFIDNGKGISTDFKEIFEPGFTTKKRGWGLGLSLCKRIIEDYFGGKIYVKWSQPYKGTQFRIELPLK